MNGFVHIKGVCEPAEVAELVGAIDTTAIDDQCGDLDAAGIKSLRNPWNRSMLFVGYLDRDPVAVVAEQALGSGSGPGGGASPPEHNHVVSMVATRAKPGAPASDDGLHLDFLPIEVDSDLLASGEIEMPMFITTAVYCLTAGPAEIGVVAGSHLAGRAPKPQEQTFNGTGPTRLQVEAGDVIMFRCESWKCVFANEVRLPLGPDCVSLPIQLGCQCTLLNTFHTGSQSATPRHALRVHYSQPHIGHRFQPYVNQGGETGFQFVSYASC